MWGKEEILCWWNNLLKFGGVLVAKKTKKPLPELEAHSVNCECGIKENPGAGECNFTLSGTPIRSELELIALDLAKTLKEKSALIAVATDPTDKYRLANVDAAFDILCAIVWGDFYMKIKHGGGKEYKTPRDMFEAYRDFVIDKLTEAGIDLSKAM